MIWLTFLLFQSHCKEKKSFHSRANSQTNTNGDLPFLFKAGQFWRGQFKIKIDTFINVLPVPLEIMKKERVIPQYFDQFNTSTNRELIRYYCENDQTSDECLSMKLMMIQSLYST